MASTKSSGSSHGRRNDAVHIGVAGVGNTDINSKNHPEQKEPETTGQLENVAQTYSNTAGQTVSQTVNQQASKSQSEVIAEPPLSQRQQVMPTRVVSTEKGAIQKSHGLQTVTTKTKDPVKVPHAPIVNVPLRRNPPRRVREKIVSSCGLCVEADDERMV